MKKRFARILLFIFSLFIFSRDAFAGANSPTSTNTPKPSCSHSITNNRRAPVPDKVIIVLGQSNAQGFGQQKQLENTHTPDDVFAWREGENVEKQRWEGYKIGKCFGPELGFARKWASDHPKETLGIIKLAIGSTSMGDWQPYWTPHEVTKDNAGPLFSKSLSLWKQAGRLPIVAILWDQGGTDSGNANLATRYYQRLNDFITQWRAHTGNMSFIIGQTQAIDAPYIATINEAENTLQSTLPDVKIAPTKDLPTYEGTHFTTSSQLELGQRMYTAWKR